MAVIKRNQFARQESFVPEGMSRIPTQAALQTRNFAAAMKINAGLPVNVEAIVIHYGIRVEYVVMEDDLSGYIENRPSGWLIGVNRYHAPTRQRFTLAHELGHYILHRERIGIGEKIEDKMLLRTESFGVQVEEEANEFAAELLMPAQEFTALIRSSDGKIDKIAAFFGVSLAAARYRATKLGLRIS